MSGLLTLGFPAFITRVIAGIPGGIQNKILFTPVENILSFGGVQPVTHSLQTLVLNGVAWSWAKMPDRGKGYGEKSKKGESGPFTESVLRGTVPYYTKANTHAMNMMKYYRWIVMFKQRDGSLRIMGTPDDGAHFDYEIDTGDGGKDVAKAQVIFNWISEDGAAFFEPPGSFTF